MELPPAEPYKIKMVEAIHQSHREQREKWIAEAGYNVFRLKSEQVYIDLLTDSGTGAMSDRQWSAMMLGDETYAGATSFFILESTVKRLTGLDYMLPTHQGRAAENVLFSVLIKPGDVVPGNSHFDTTKGHIELRKGSAIDCTVDEAFDTQVEVPFKGNVCLQKLERALAEFQKKVPLIIMTLTNNAAGGQPVSMENLRDVHRLARKYDKPIVLDAARFAENAYFIKIREKGYEQRTIKEIIKEMCSYADAITMSGKKDGYVNMGGFLATRHRDWFEAASNYTIMFEGYVTYGGMSGRDMNALAVGLEESTEFQVLDARVRQVAYLGRKLDEYGIPYQRPIGGHAIYVDVLKLLPQVPKEEFPAQLLCVELYLESGVRAVEIGPVMAGRDPFTGENCFNGLQLLRMAIPRRTYTDNHMNVVAVALKNIYDRRNTYQRGVKIVKEAPILRHFTAQFQLL